MQELLEVRDFISEGGRVLYGGQRAGQQYVRPNVSHRGATDARVGPLPARRG